MTEGFGEWADASVRGRPAAWEAVILEYSRRTADKSAQAVKASAEATKGWAQRTAIATVVIALATIASVVVAVLR